MCCEKERSLLAAEQEDFVSRLAKGSTHGLVFDSSCDSAFVQIEARDLDRSRVNVIMTCMMCKEKGRQGNTEHFVSSSGK
jgi:hypothetical protein